MRAVVLGMIVIVGVLMRVRMRGTLFVPFALHLRFDSHPP
jgi:hypothetical protein